MNTDFEKLKITEDEFAAVKIANSADRPNAMSTYGGAKKSAQDVKAMFDKAPKLLMGKHNDLVDGVVAVVREVAKQGEKVTELHDALESGELKGEKGDAYILTEADKAEIADKVEVEMIGDINEALERIIEIQNALGAVITFSIHYNVDDKTVTLKANYGMTWEEWCNSEYNTIGARINPDNGQVLHLYDDGNEHSISYAEDRRVNSYDVIEKNRQYICMDW